MTPKEKAEQLVDRFWECKSDTKDTLESIISKELAKQCALICVEFTKSIGVSPQDKILLEEVKQEINKLC